MKQLNKSPFRQTTTVTKFLESRRWDAPQLKLGQEPRIGISTAKNRILNDETISLTPAAHCAWVP